MFKARYELTLGVIALRQTMTKGVSFGLQFQIRKIELNLTYCHHIICGLSKCIIIE